MVVSCDTVAARDNCRFVFRKPPAMQEDRIRHAGLRDRVVDADHAAALIQPGETVAMSGFTGSGYPKAVPLALAARIEQAHAAGQSFQIKLMTGASTAPELDGALAKADAIALRMPFQSDPDARKRINDGTLDYIDIHLSHVAQHVWFGFYGPIDTAVVEVSAIRRGRHAGALHVDRQQQDLAGPGQQGHRGGQRLAARRHGGHARHLLRHRVAAAPQADPDGARARPHRRHHPALRSRQDRCRGAHAWAGRNSPFTPIDAARRGRIAGHLIEFLKHEVALGRLPPTLLPLQSGVGNI